MHPPPFLPAALHSCPTCRLPLWLTRQTFSITDAGTRRWTFCLGCTHGHEYIWTEGTSVLRDAHADDPAAAPAPGARRLVRLRLVGHNLIGLLRDRMIRDRVIVPREK